MFKTRFISMLALLMTAATGAWAQSAFTVKEITSASQLTSTDDEAYVAACMPSDFLAVDVDVAKAWTGAPTDATAILIYAIDGDKNKIASFLNGSYGRTTDAIWSIAYFKNQMANIKFYYTAASPYSVSLKNGVKDADKWTVKVGEGQAQALPIGGLKGDGSETVTLQYSGRLKVKGVKATSDAAPAANPNAYLKWDGTQKKLVATPMPESFTTVTSENTEWSAGTYVVEGQVDITSSIELSGDVNLIIKDGAKLTVYHLYGNSHNLSIYGQAQMTGELDVFNSGGDAINEIPTLEVHSAKVTATSSSDYSGGFGDIGTFNVYGGLVDAKNTGSQGFGILLKECGYMNIYGGEVKAEGTGNDRDVSYGITSSASISSDAANVRVYGGKLWAGNANNSALNQDGIYLTKDNGYTSGKIEYSSDNSNWSETFASEYVRVGY